MNATTSRVICFGEILMRLTPPGRARLTTARSLDLHVGGAEANVAVGLSRLGSPAAMLSALPATALGELARSILLAHGVDLRWLAKRDGRLGLYFAELGAGLRPTEVTYDRAGSAFALTPPEFWDWEGALEGAGWLHLSGVTAALGAGPAAAALAGAQAAARRGLEVAFDGNFRAALWRDAGVEPAERLRPILACATLAFVDDRDLALILGRSFEDHDPMARRRHAAEAAFDAFPRLQRIACTLRGPAGWPEIGAALFTREAEHVREAMPLDGAIERIGAGDAFAAGLLHGLISGMDDDHALAFGHAAGALKHFIPGDLPVFDAAEIERLLDQGGGDIRR